MLGWAVPVLCMMIAVWTFWSQRQQFQIESTIAYQAHRDNELQAKELETDENLPANTRIGAVDQTPEEETTFLTYLRTLGAMDHVELKNWASQTIEYGKDKVATPMDEKTAAVLKGLRRISGFLTLTGTYSAIRQMVGELETSKRLYTMNTLNWSVTPLSLQLSMNISRYVSPSKPGTAKKPLANTTPGSRPSPASTTVKPGAKKPTEPVQIGTSKP